METKVGGTLPLYLDLEEEIVQRMVILCDLLLEHVVVFVLTLHSSRLLCAEIKNGN